jgi:hypothetical protein
VSPFRSSPSGGNDTGDGERHPDAQETVGLRGQAVKRGSRLVRQVSWVSSHLSGRTSDSGCPKGSQGRACSSAYAQRAHPRSLRASVGTHPSLGPSNSRLVSLVVVQGLRSSPAARTLQVSHLGKPRWGVTMCGVSRCER